MIMKKIKGIIPPMVTPLIDNSTIDYEGAYRIADRMIDAGVAGIFILGTTGESQSLAMRLRYEYVERICAYVGTRVPVLVGITETSLEDSLSLARHAAGCGATAVVSAPPYYFPANQSELTVWYTALADACPLPVYLYNMPSKVKVFLEIPTVLALSRHPNIVGLKDSSNNHEYLRELIGIFRGSDFATYMGPEEYTSEMVLLGCDGGVNGGANLFPELFVQSYNAAASGNERLAREYNDRILYLSRSLYGLDPDSDASFLRGLKCALGLQGLCSPYVAYPYRQYEGELKEKAAAALRDLNAKNYK